MVLLAGFRRALGIAAPAPAGLHRAAMIGNVALGQEVLGGMTLGVVRTAPRTA